jgi:predicted transcriptional regulator
VHASLPPPGRLVADVDGARVQCHLCGRFYAKLGYHVSQRHGMDPDEYREQFGLNRGTPLASPALSQKLSHIHREHLISM